MKRDKLYLEHIQSTICDITQFLKGTTKEDFCQNKEKQYAILRALENYW
jgi:uncharacterized protein with HEPN domain